MAVAGLLGCNEYISDAAANDESANHFEQLHDDGPGLFFATETSSLRYNDDASPSTNYSLGGQHLTAENGAALPDPTSLDFSDSRVTGTESSSGVEGMSAVDSLMADLSQLNAQSAAPVVRMAIPNGSVYYPTPPSKILPAKRTASDAARNHETAAGSDADSESVNGSSLSDGVAETMDGQVDNTMQHSSRSLSFAAFCNRGAKFDCEPELDAAIKSILS